ncbi:hypothetical protein MNBD_ACTINO01-574 [hydrothermal vent metagenome]|uniref:Uncharacterized protein n=1 Tax=hydrothermal vent metagenome TaxID=652676 RepID=A0A3B0SHV8_9ZZZZ
MTWTAGIAVVWLIVGVLRPETTLHLGPIFLPLLPAFLLRGRQDALNGVLAGVAMASLTIVVLTITGNMDGPAVAPFSDPLTESIAVLAGAAILGLIVSRTGQRT